MGRARYLVVTVGVAALVGCGDDEANRPDTAQVEGDLARTVQQQTGTRDVRVSCPGDVGEGDLCDVSAPGGLDAQVKVTRLADGEVEGEIVQP
jgi:hypothetical protein